MTEKEEVLKCGNNNFKKGAQTNQWARGLDI